MFAAEDTIADADSKASGSAQRAPFEVLRSPFAGRVQRRGPLKVALSPIRVVMRGPMFPGVVKVGPRSLIIAAAAAEEHSDTVSIRSDDLGQTWRPYKPGFASGSALNVLGLNDGRIVSLFYDTKPIAGRDGYFSTRRWESDDQWKTVRGPLTDGALFLPPADFDPARRQWFHGNVIQLPDGELLAAMQGVEKSGRGIYPFHTFLSRSADGGKSWKFVSRIASLGTIHDPAGLTKKGWTLHGPCEPCVAHLGEGKLVCVARLVNDDSNPLIGPATDTYRDLSYTLPAGGIHGRARGQLKLRADKFYTPGPPSVPLIISFSPDRGRTWSRPEPMREARGCFPRLAVSDGILALVYGGLAYPRWGNCITLSPDGGRNWTEQINFGPFFTTGYAGVVAISPGRFLCVFDCTPPQPWTNHAAHWVGVVDVDVKAAPQ